jgi:hypothetical protein
MDSAEATEHLTAARISMAPADKKEDREGHHDALRRSSTATRLVDGAENSGEPVDRAALLYDPPLIAVTTAA